MRRLIDMPSFQKHAAANPPRPYVCNATLKRWIAGEFDTWEGGRPTLARLARTAYFGKRTWAAPNGGCHNCGGAYCTQSNNWLESLQEGFNCE